MEKEVLLSEPPNKNQRWLNIFIGVSLLFQSASHYGNSNVLFMVTLSLGIALIIIAIFYYDKFYSKNYIKVNDYEIIFKQNNFQKKKTLLWNRIKRIDASSYKLSITYDGGKEYKISFSEMSYNERHKELNELLKLIDEKGKSLPSCYVKY
ncbi:MAG: hypothetical protein HYZ10_08110 [Ignavibacteriales bacterium]|nr:hypothetical protein [Ignavibacteriales bacterium]